MFILTPDQKLYSNLLNCFFNSHIWTLNNLCENTLFSRKKCTFVFPGEHLQPEFYLKFQLELFNLSISAKNAGNC